MVVLAFVRPQAESRPWQILSLIARHEAMSVAELVVALGVTTTAVRQHVNRLVWERWLVRHQRRGGPGRPADVFALSEEGKRLFAHDVDDFARQLLREIAETDGPEKLRALLDRVSQRLGQGLESAAGPGGPTERIEKLVRQLQERGTVADARPTESGLRLSVYTCPFHGLGDARQTMCEAERRTLSRIGGGAAELKHSIAGGHWCCEFEVAVEAKRDGAP